MPKPVRMLVFATAAISAACASGATEVPGAGPLHRAFVSVGSGPIVLVRNLGGSAGMTGGSAGGMTGGSSAGGMTGSAGGMTGSAGGMNGRMGGGMAEQAGPLDGKREPSTQTQCATPWFSSLFHQARCAEPPQGPVRKDAATTK
jgi:hypothetical protein